MLARGEADAAMIIASDPMAELQPAGPRASGGDSLHRARSQGNAHHAGRHRGLHHGDLRHQHAGHGLSHGRRADSAAARLRLAASQRFRNPLGHRAAGQTTQGGRARFHNRTWATATRNMASSLFKISGGTVYDPRTASTARCATSGFATAGSSTAPTDPHVRPDTNDRRHAAWSSCPAASTCTATSPGRR